MSTSITKYIESHVKNEIFTNSKSLDWVTISNAEKISRINLTDAIQAYFIPHCIEQGSNNASRYYSNFSNLINKYTLLPFSPIDRTIKEVIKPKISIQSILSAEQLAERIIATDALTSLVTLIVEEYESPWVLVEYHKAFKTVKADFIHTLDTELNIVPSHILPDLVADVKQMYAEMRGDK